MNHGKEIVKINGGRIIRTFRPKDASGATDRNRPDKIDHLIGRSILHDPVDFDIIGLGRKNLLCGGRPKDAPVRGLVVGVRVVPGLN